MPPGLLLLVLFFLLGIPALVGVAIHYQRKRRDAAERSAKPVPRAVAPRTRPDLDAHLIRVTREFEDPERFTQAARAVAEHLPFNEAVLLTESFHQNPPMPPELVPALSKRGVLGVWMDVCQNAIFEVLFHYRAEALPVLYPIAFGVYDWTQYKAVRTLMRLADDGVETAEIRAKLSAFASTTADEDEREGIRAWLAGPVQQA